MAAVDSRGKRCRVQAAPAPVVAPGRGRGGILRRKCACGQHAPAGGECERCRKKRLELQRRAIDRRDVSEVPPIVHRVLQAPGQPLDDHARAFMEPRFGYELGHVRVHTGSAAEDSAGAVGAEAYTVGSNIVFGRGLYSAGTDAGRSLLAHELAHVVRQRADSTGARPNVVAPWNDPEEQRADAIAGRVMSGARGAAIDRGAPPALRRRLVVENPGEMIPNPTGSGQEQTNAETAEGYLQRLAPEGDVSVDRTSGEVDMRTGFCPGVVGGLVRGGEAGYRIGHTIGSAGGNIPLFGEIFGAIGALIGGLIGFFGGLFGADISQAASSDRPAGSTCVCDFVHGGEQTVIEINDDERPVGAAARVRVPSPNNRLRTGAATQSGRLEITEPWLIVAHELCGHAWLAIHGGDYEEGRPEDRAPLVGRDRAGQPRISEPEGTPDDPFGGPMRQPRAGQYLRHGRTVERENRIRAEHGLEARGFRLRDPYCGESFTQERGVANAPRRWQEDRGSDVRTFLEQCEFLRSQLPESRRRRYRIDEQIPEE